MRIPSHVSTILINPVPIRLTAQSRSRLNACVAHRNNSDALNIKLREHRLEISRAQDLFLAILVIVL